MTIAVILATIFQCSPVDAVYNPHKYHHYSCFASIPFWYATAALSLVTDVWILVLPLRTILGESFLPPHRHGSGMFGSIQLMELGLQVGRKKRLMVVGLLSLGTL